MSTHHSDTTNGLWHADFLVPGETFITSDWSVKQNYPAKAMTPVHHKDKGHNTGGKAFFDRSHELL